MKKNAIVAIGILAVFVAGCASVHVNKLKSDGTIDTAAPDGMRFYLPRPYVSVNEPFVIATTVYLATGEMSPDGSFVLLTEVPDTLKSAVALNPKLISGTQTMGEIAIDASKVLVSTPPAGGGPQGAPAGNQPPKNPEPPNSAPTPAGGTPGSTPGVLQYKVTNDNQAYAVIPQPRFYNVVWLPDWDEEYVITAKAGFGTAGATINMGQGWSLQGLDAKVDNSAVVKPLLDFYSGALGALQKVATAKIEGPLAAVTGKPQGASAKNAPSTAKSAFGGGTPVTIKITKARVVAPGLYKILKPKELAQLATLNLTSDEAARILKPTPPLTDIAFATYDVVVIEAARATGDSAFTLGQYTEAASKTLSSTAPAPNPGPTNPTGATTPLATAQKKLNVVLSQPENMTTAGLYFVAALSNDPKTGDVLASLQTTNGGKGGKVTALPSDADVTTLVVKTLAPTITVDPKNVTVKH